MSRGDIYQRAFARVALMWLSPPASNWMLRGFLMLQEILPLIRETDRFALLITRLPHSWIIHFQFENASPQFDCT